MRHKTFEFEVKSIDEMGTFEGYASVFGNVDLMNEIVAPGAFTKTLAERGHKVRLCWQHDIAQPIGKPIELRQDEHGLYIKGKISNTTMGRDALTLMRDGVVGEMSIGYDVIKDEFTKDGDKDVRQLKELRLYEISLVTVAANPEAAITHVKEKPELDKSEDFYTIDTKGAIPYKKTSLADVEAPWDAAAEMAKADSPEAWRAMCALIDGDPESKGSYKLPHHQGGGNHACVWNGVKAALGALNGARRRVQGEGLDGARSHILKHYKDFGKPAPGESESEDNGNERENNRQNGDREQRSKEPSEGTLQRRKLALQAKLLGLECNLKEDNHEDG